jgi:hypothetical protein
MNQNRTVAAFIKTGAEKPFKNDVLQYPLSLLPRRNHEYLSSFVWACSQVAADLQSQSRARSRDGLLTEEMVGICDVEEQWPQQF